MEGVHEQRHFISQSDDLERCDRRFGPMKNRLNGLRMFMS